MILNDETIIEMIFKDNLIYVDNKEIENGYLYSDGVQPASYDLKLGRSYIDKSYAREMNPVPTLITDKDLISIPPKGFVLATTLEYVKIPNDICAFIEGRSSVGRTGLFIHNAGLIDPGFEGQITLELFNASNDTIYLKPGMRICQIVFHAMYKPAIDPYNGKYQHQKNATASKLYLDEEMNK